MEWVELALSVVAGLTATIPLVIKLIEYVKKSIREKNWPGLLEMVMGYMEVAEGKFKTGAEKKEWVLAMVKASADTINYDIDMNVVSDMIDDLCDMSNIINPPAEKAGE
jgi:hypothetical protein